MAAPRYRALLIGNSRFPLDPSLQNLEGPVNDLAALREALTDPVSGQFEPGAVRLAPERTAKDMLVEIERFFSSSSRDDTLLLYYSGHGRLDMRNQLFLCAADTDSSVLKATAVSNAQISMMIEDAAANTTIIILDCCHSGAFKGGEMAASLTGSGRFVVTSCRGTELANDTDRLNHTSLFTQYLVEALREGATDGDGDGDVVLDEVYDYVHERLRSLSPRRPTPQRNFSGTGDVAIARRPDQAQVVEAVEPAAVPAPPAERPPPSPLPPTKPEPSLTPPPPVPPDRQLPLEPPPKGRGRVAAGVAWAKRRRRVVLPGVLVFIGLMALLLSLLSSTGGDSCAGPACLDEPYGLAADDDGNLYIADSAVNLVKKRTPAGEVSVYAGGGESEAAGPATEAALGYPVALALDEAGNLHIGGGDGIRVVSPDGQMRPVATHGAGVVQVTPRGIAVDPDGNHVVTVGASILRVKPDGALEVIAGKEGIDGFAGDGGPAEAAKLDSPNGLAFDDQGNLYVADQGNNRIRMVKKEDNTIVTVAGTGGTRYSGDGGPAEEAGLNAPSAVAFDADGNGLILEGGGGRLRRVAQDGTITTIAGGEDSGWFEGDGGAATKAILNAPNALALDDSGNIYICDSGNQRVRKIDAKNGVITTVA